VTLLLTSLPTYRLTNVLTCPGYCFVTFAEPEHAEAAVSALDGAPGSVPASSMP